MFFRAASSALRRVSARTCLSSGLAIGAAASFVLPQPVRLSPPHTTQLLSGREGGCPHASPAWVHNECVLTGG